MVDIFEKNNPDSNSQVLTHTTIFAISSRFYPARRRRAAFLAK